MRFSGGGIAIDSSPSETILFKFMLQSELNATAVESRDQNLHFSLL